MEILNELDRNIHSIGWRYSLNCIEIFIQLEVVKKATAS